MKRIEIETKLNEGRIWILAMFADLTEEQLHRPFTSSQHDPDNYWSALDHFAHLGLIERNFEQVVRRHLAGDEYPVGLLLGSDGRPRTREEIMATVNAMTERFQREHHNDSLSEVVALTPSALGVILQLLSELSDDQLEEKLVGAPWADGTIGGVLGVNADHGRGHWKWVTEAGLLDVVR
jgi:hypothetical protein